MQLNGDRKTIARTYAGKKDFYVGEAGANVALIAAAPELLDAARAALRYLEANRPDSDVRKDFTSLNEHENIAVKPLRAAIAKAEGGQG